MRDKPVKVGEYFFQYKDFQTGDTTSKIVGVMSDGGFEHLDEIREAFDEFLRGCSFVIMYDYK